MISSENERAVELQQHHNRQNPAEIVRVSAKPMKK
jgi:hypothetical protein